MDLKTIKQVIDLMKRSELSEFEFEEDGFKLRLSRESNNSVAPIIQSVAPVNPVAATPATPAPASSAEKEKAEDPNVETIKSPMVGTFYRAPSPDSANFTDVGKKVDVDSIVCIIEAMKVMNEIQAEVKGTITEILVEDGDAIEFGQPLFKYKKA
ncbi:MAG: acetyl-CoA carboxylase, biotin carboxyl carrier protein [Puniceicoccaceae bacterium MED-G32]|nr:acetyl-CoA carboxylase, biotin carboxyl carrier protein [Puniceicoccaceae bacterium]PDH26032.1 MAG: acetyl-CoA carboxylase, biotin carboxyl carrier protein [Puniceicoccaceae bacterium MED-G32]